MSVEEETDLEVVRSIEPDEFLKEIVEGGAHRMTVQCGKAELDTVSRELLPTRGCYLLNFDFKRGEEPVLWVELRQGTGPQNSRSIEAACVEYVKTVNAVRDIIPNLKVHLYYLPEPGAESDRSPSLAAINLKVREGDRSSSFTDTLRSKWHKTTYVQRDGHSIRERLLDMGTTVLVGLAAYMFNINTVKLSFSEYQGMKKGRENKTREA